MIGTKITRTNALHVNKGHVELNQYQNSAPTLHLRHPSWGMRAVCLHPNEVDDLIAVLQAYKEES